MKKKELKDIKKVLEKQQYAIVGNHSGVQVCLWTKNSLNKKGVCWKEKFYGIRSHQCCQFSPAVMWCENSCLHCWRPIELNLGKEIPENKINNPKEIIDGVIEARKRLLEGFKGNKKVSRKKLGEAFEPKLFTMSLSGEPTIYPYIGGLVDEIRKRRAVSFIVTNGLNPEKIKELADNKQLPTQLVVSVNAPNKQLFNIWHNSKKKDAWDKLNKTLELLKELKGKTRRVVRLTLVKKSNEENPKEGKKKLKHISNMNEEHADEYVQLIKKAEPDFVHIKGYKGLGFARHRMGYDKQPTFYEVRRFVELLLKELKKEKETKEYKILAKDERSCVFCLGKSKRGMKINMKKV